jgi:hypothetical protein
MVWLWPVTSVKRENTGKWKGPWVVVVNQILPFLGVLAWRGGWSLCGGSICASPCARFFSLCAQRPPAVVISSRYYKFSGGMNEEKEKGDGKGR